jgi:hypothetical protein
MSFTMPSPRAVRVALAVAVTILVLPGGTDAADIDRPYDSSRSGDPYDDPRYADIYGQRGPANAGGSEQGYRYRYVDRSGGRDEEAPPEERYQDGPDVDDNGDGERYADDRSADRGVRVDRYEEEVPPEDRPRAYGRDDRRYDPPRSYKDDDQRFEPPRRYSDAPLPGPRHHYRDEPSHDRRGCTPRREIRRALMHDGWFDFRGLELRGDIALVRARRDNGRVFALKLDRCTGRVLRAEVISPPDGGRWVAGPRRFYPTY